ncbi:phage tail protein [Salinirubrum litoreum]|jgi:phage tail-like protein|uniref:Phage tail protein n=1 Tax=Salinirubrum litoreum TaxID=1126234 RepID=A0ABD5RDU9_9EURY|nr:phage tail protein [Salinirubrum litoreum]
MPDRHGPFRNFRFLLEIEGIVQAGFSECTLPESSTEAVEYRNGNEQPTVRKIKGLNSYGNLSLQWGITESTELYDWWKTVENGNVDDARRPIAVVVQDEVGDPGPRFQFREAWPRQYDAPDLNATGNEVSIESLEIVHEGMERSA